MILIFLATIFSQFLIHPINLNVVQKTSPIDVLFESSKNARSARSNINSRVQNTLDLLYISPEQLLSDVFTLNQKHLLSSSYYQGWLLPSEVPIDLDLYIFYEGQYEAKIRPFYSSKVAKSNGTLNETNEIEPQSGNKATLMLFFTTYDNCLHDYLNTNRWPFEIVEQIASNMYKAKVSNCKLPYSDLPLHVCLQQIDGDENIHDNFRYI